jgi:hypothetical protein
MQSPTPLRSLTDIANSNGTDKGTTSKIPHGYSLVYDTLFGLMRDKPEARVRELGLAAGGPEHGVSKDRVVTTAPNVDSWLQYFPNCHVFAFEISDFSPLQNDRFTFFHGYAGSWDDLIRMREMISRPVDIIIDDASHASYHQTLCLRALFPLLRPGGLYVVEDLHWQPEVYERCFLRAEKCATKFTVFGVRAAFFHRSGATLYAVCRRSSH